MAVLRRAAVLGESFHSSVLVALCDGEFSKVQRALADAMEAGVLEQRLDGTHAFLYERTREHLRGTLSLIEKNPPFQMMPTTEPEFFCEIWVMQVA